MTRYRTKVDFWYYLLFPVIVVAIALGAMEPWRAGDMPGVYGAVVVGALVLGLQSWLLNTAYLVSTEEVLVISGPIRWKIPRAEIEQIVPTRSVLSSPALSFDRLKISYSNGRTLLVSPADKEAFLTELGFS